MKRMLPLLLTVLLASAALQAQPPPPPGLSVDVQIAPWLEDRGAAVSLTFDDNLRGQWDNALPRLNARNLRASFYVITGQVNWADANAAYATGHEIGSHSVSHVNLTQAANPLAQLRDSHDTLLARYPAQRSLTIAWPFGAGGGSNAAQTAVRNLAKDYYIGARNASVGPNGYEPGDLDRPLQVGARLMDSASSISTLATLLDSAAKNRGWAAWMYHGVGNFRDFANVPNAHLEEQLDTLVARQNRGLLWVAPFREVSMYQREKISTDWQSFLTDGPTAIDVDVVLEDTLDNNLFYHPLTLRLTFSEPVFATATVDYARQNGHAVWHQVLNDTTLLVNGVPDSGAVQIRLLKPTGLARVLERSVQMAPNPASDRLVIRSLATDNPLKAWTLRDPLGRVLAIESLGETVETQVSIAQIPAGTYFLQVETAQGSLTKRLVVTR